MATTPESAGAPQAVLYVEDHPVNVLLMEALFSKRSNAVLHVAMTGMQAWRMSASLKPALLLLDLRLPDCQGGPLLKLLRQRPGWKDIRAIAVTAEYEFELEGSGFLEIWSKPLNLPAVMARLDQLLQSDAATPSPAGASGLAGDGGLGSEGGGTGGSSMRNLHLAPPDRLLRNSAPRVPLWRSMAFQA